MYNYYWSRYILTGKTPTGDDGSTNRCAIQAVVNYGAPYETEWPYIASNLNKKPPANVQSDASKFKLLKYYRLDLDTMSGNDIYNEAIKSLQMGIPFIAGFECYHDALVSAENNGIVKYPKGSDENVGAHSVFFDGHTAKNGFIFDNSWGLDCPTNPVNGLKRGHMLLADNYFKKSKVTDLWCVTNESLVSKLAKI